MSPLEARFPALAELSSKTTDAVFLALRDPELSSSLARVSAEERLACISGALIANLVGTFYLSGRSEDETVRRSEELIRAAFVAFRKNCQN